MKKKNTIQIFGFSLIRTAMIVVLVLLIIVLGDILLKGKDVISFDFLLLNPSNGMTEGGIFPAILGTFLVTLLTALISIPIGVSCAIYLNEYAVDNQLTRLIRSSIRNLAGVPSMVYGLFGVLIFVQMLHFGTSLLSAGLTLGLLALPTIITTSEEALKNVPNGYRYASLALGASKWTMIKTSVLPYSLSGILTGTILSLSRTAGETAPILFTGVAFYLPDLPQSPFSQFMALPYHLYILATQHHDITKVAPIAYGTALVLICFIFSMNLVAIIIRYRVRRSRIE